MKLIKTNEVRNCLEEISINVKEYLYGNMRDYDYTKAKADTVKELNQIYSNLGIDFEVKHNPSSFFDIPYNKDIKFDSVKNNGSVSLQKFTINKNILHMFDYPISDEYLKTYVLYGAYTKNIDTFRIVENGNTYMTPTIMEYNTMKDEIDRASGKVLTFGLGIGFFQYMCLLKDTVESVTVVEKNKIIIEFFEEYILPQFRNKNIKIIKGNAYDYFEKDYFKKFDYVFVDIYFNNDDGFEVYRKLLKSDVDMANVGFWIENQILLQIKMLVASYLFNHLKGTVSEVLSLENSFTEDFKYIHKLFRQENVVIDSEEKILRYINDKEFLRKIIKR